MRSQVVAGLAMVIVVAGCGVAGEQPDAEAGRAVAAVETEDARGRATLGSETDDSGPVDQATAPTSTTVVVSGSTTTTTAAAPPTERPTTATSETTVTTTAPTTAPTTTTARQTTAPTEPTPVAPAPVVGGARSIPAQTWAPFARFAEVTLTQPSLRIERIGFHESNHDGARQLEPLETVLAMGELPSRDRDTGSRTAADVVVEPGTEIRAPVTGTVVRAGGYILYCEHNDDFVVIEPDSRPGWEVKILHISGVQVAAGDRVEAGVTVLAPAATPLPFDSQVDEFTAEPSWPHVHIELVDPSIPDRPSKGGGC